MDGSTLTDHMPDLRVWLEMEAQCQSQTCANGENPYGCSVRAEYVNDIACAGISALWCENRMRLHVEELYQATCTYCGATLSYRHWRIRPL